ncbi:hypothetical protein ACQKEU_28590, partial [Acidovorax sp. NPDC077664]
MSTPSAAISLPSGPIQVRGACPHDCPDTCALITTVDDNGVATRVQGNPDHPHTDGVLCAKVSKYTERSYHPERVLTPLKRTGPKGPGGSGQFAVELAAVVEVHLLRFGQRAEVLGHCELLERLE